jgi:tetratricopeptide (TPR) repeat protein
MLLDFAIADPANDGMVRLWYRATAAYMAGNREHATAGPHLFRARTLFPEDADLFFYSGALYESLASPDVQTVVRTTVLPGGLTFDVATEQVNLERAETYLRRSLEISPDQVEARIRFGRVLGLLGRHEEAASELLRAQTAAPDRLLAYYANLFLGAEERALGRHDDARRYYVLARAWLPTAQSPHLGLSQLARERGDREGALLALDRLLSLPAEEARRQDPWWDYHVAHGRRAPALLAELRKPFQREAAR